MTSVICCALALLGGVIGAGFASGRELVRFFAIHGALAGAAAVCALFTLYTLFLRLCTQMEKTGCSALPMLCRARLGERAGRLCAALFFLLCAVTGGVMLAACAELGALMLPVRHAYGFTLTLTLMVCLLLSAHGLCALALPGALLTFMMPFLLLRLLALPMGEACFLPAMTPDLPVRAAADGAAYGALNAAMLAGILPLLLTLDTSRRKRAVQLFTLLFALILLPGILVCRRHLPAILDQPLPFVYLSREMGMGHMLVAACMYAAAVSTLLAMLSALALMMPKAGKHMRTALSGAACLLFSLAGFTPLVHSGYPVLGALCMALLILLCLPDQLFPRAVSGL